MGNGFCVCVYLYFFRWIILHAFQNVWNTVSEPSQGIQRLKAGEVLTDFEKNKVMWISRAVLQWERVRGPVAEWQTSRTRRRDARQVVVPRRVDARLQGTLRSATILYVQRTVRRHVGQRAAGRLWLRDICWRRWVVGDRWWVQSCVLNCGLVNLTF